MGQPRGCAPAPAPARPACSRTPCPGGRRGPQAARRAERDRNRDPNRDPDRAAPRAAHDTTAQHADAIIDFYEAAAGRTDVPVREDHPAFSERYSADSAPAAHAKQLSEQPGEAVRRRRRHHLQVR